MIERCLIAALTVVISPCAKSAFDVEEQLAKARYEYSVEDNTSSALRRIDAILEVQPDHLEARWLRLWAGRLPNLVNMDVESRMPYLRDVAEELQALVKLAEEQGNPAYGHYMLSRFARFHEAHDEAQREIDRAIQLAQTDPLYVWEKARGLMHMGIWNHDDETTYRGIDLLAHAWEMVKANPPDYFTEADFHFWTAWGLAAIKGSCSAEAPEIVEHYLAVTRLRERPNQQVAHAWNNVSCPYRSMGQCAKAKGAAKSALEIMEFGAAKTNLRYAEFCLQMQELGVLPKETSPAQ